jgi:vacuolar protein sorting-associated protein 13A/C
MVQYTTSGGSDNSSLAIVTIDSPKFILALDPLSALLDFAIAPFKSNPDQETPAPADDGSVDMGGSKQADTNPGQLAFRVNIVHATILVLANDSDPRSQVIELSVKEILLSQQSIMAFKIDQLGMAFGSMDKPDVRVRFLDDLNVAMSLDTRRKGSQQMSSYEVEIPDPIIFRASYTDIMLITDIVNKAVAVATSAGKSGDEKETEQRRRRSVSGTDASSTRMPATTSITPAQRSVTQNSQHEAQVNGQVQSACIERTTQSDRQWIPICPGGRYAGDSNGTSFGKRVLGLGAGLVWRCEYSSLLWTG